MSSIYYGTAACVLLIDDAGRILAVPRKNDPTSFGLPGGKRESHETYEEAAIREVREETGLRLSGLKKIFEGPCLGEGDVFNTITYVAEWTGRVRAGDTGQPKWVTWEDLFAGSFGKYNRELFEVFQRLNPLRLSMTEDAVA